jgi:hypothetical protein
VMRLVYLPEEHLVWVDMNNNLILQGQRRCPAGVKEVDLDGQELQGVVCRCPS